MLSVDAQKKLENFIVKFSNENNIGMYRANEAYYKLVNNLFTNIQSDQTVDHIAINYKIYRYAVAKRNYLTALSTGQKLYSAWQYFDLFTGDPITNVIFINGLNELEKNELTKIIYIQAKKLDPIKWFDFLIDDKEKKNTDKKNDFDFSLLNKNYTAYKPDVEFNTSAAFAGFDMKNILWIGLLAGGIYMVMKK